MLVSIGLSVLTKKSLWNELWLTHRYACSYVVLHHHHDVQLWAWLKLERNFMKQSEILKCEKQIVAIQAKKEAFYYSLGIYCSVPMRLVSFRLEVRTKDRKGYTHLWSVSGCQFRALWCQSCFVQTSVKKSIYRILHFQIVFKKSIIALLPDKYK